MLSMERYSGILCHYLQLIPWNLYEEAFLVCGETMEWAVSLTSTPKILRIVSRTFLPAMVHLAPAMFRPQKTSSHQTRFSYDFQPIILGLRAIKI